MTRLDRRRTRRRVRWALLLSLAVGAAAAGTARASPGEAPRLEIEVDGPLDVDLARRVGVGRGRVRLRRGPVRICCGRLELKYGERGVEAATCTEKVAVAVDPDPTEAATGGSAPGGGAPARPAVWATAERVRYVDGRVELEGAVRLWTLGGRLSGERFTYVIEGRRARLVGAPSRWVPTAAPPVLPRPCPASP